MAPSLRRLTGLAFSVLLSAALAGCSGTGPPAVASPPAAAQPAAAGLQAAEAVRVTLLHLNDVYEITPVEAGKSGGLARVATLLRRLEAENPNTYALLAGDLFSPSALGTAKVAGERLAGRQMVAVLNAMGLDYATFGNHEFDIKEAEFAQRVAESDFPYVSANVFDASGKPFPGSSPYAVITAEGPGGGKVRIGLVGVTLDSNQQDWVTYSDGGDPIPPVRREVQALAGQVDLLIALTHLSRDQDSALAQAVPELDLILGGHEHENMELRRGPDFTPIYKADANARSVWIHDLTFHPDTGAHELSSRFVRITDEIPSDPQVQAVVDHWVDAGLAGFRQQGFDPEARVTVTTETLDGREAAVRNGSTRLTELIADAMLHAVAGAELAVYNSGSIRIDDELPPGPLTEYDVIRILPFGGDVLGGRIKGALLERALKQGQASKESGAFLQTAAVSVGADGSFQVAGQPLDPARLYRLAISDYLANGNEQGMGFLAPGPDLELDPAGADADVRRVLISELQAVYGQP